MMLGKAWWSWVVATCLGVALATGSCGGSATDSAGNGDGGAADATNGCTSDAACASQVPPTMPPNCAVGKCDTIQGICTFVAKDGDGDGHPGANCTSTNSVAVQAGDDCNDQDPNLYPGHPESCSMLPDGGTPTSAPCVYGRIVCLANGTQSTCMNTVTCTNQACVAGSCQGVCEPGQTQCNGQSTGVETCGPSGTWGPPVTCTGQTCSGSGGVASCGGSCAPTQTKCVGNGVATCDSTGNWGSPVACVGQTCVAGICQGVCAPGQQQCLGLQPQQCDASGTWQNVGPPCPSVCTGAGSCSGSCTPGSLKCSTSNPQQPQQCDSTGTWQNSGSPCPFVCSSGACTGGCVPGAKQCVGLQPQQCDATGTWQNVGSPCPDVCSGGACTGSCVPGSTQCSGNTVQTCNSSGAWQNSTNCGGSTPACLNGACVTCAPGAQQACGNCGTQTCTASGSWGGCVGNTSLSQACGNCGTQYCTSSGTWGNCAGTGQVVNCNSCGTSTCDPSTGYWTGCSGNNGTAPPSCAALAGGNVCGSVSCNTANGTWDTSGCFGPNSCPAGWQTGGALGCVQSNPEENIWYMSDSGGGHDFGTWIAPQPMTNASWDHSVLTTSYGGSGGCWNSGTTAYNVNFTNAGGGGTFGQAVSESQAGYSGSSAAVFNYDNSCCSLTPAVGADIVQNEGWTPSFQGKCYRNATFDVYWTIPLQCP